VASGNFSHWEDSAERGLRRTAPGDVPVHVKKLPPSVPWPKNALYLDGCVAITVEFAIKKKAPPGGRPLFGNFHLGKVGLRPPARQSFDWEDGASGKRFPSY